MSLTKQTVGSVGPRCEKEEKIKETNDREKLKNFTVFGRWQTEYSVVLETVN